MDKTLSSSCYYLVSVPNSHLATCILRDSHRTDFPVLWNYQHLDNLIIGTTVPQKSINSKISHFFFFFWLKFQKNDVKNGMFRRSISTVSLKTGYLVRRRFVGSSFQNRFQILFKNIDYAVKFSATFHSRNTRSFQHDIAFFFIVYFLEYQVLALYARSWICGEFLLCISGCIVTYFNDPVL